MASQHFGPFPTVDYSSASEGEANERFRRIVEAVGSRRAMDIETRNPDFRLRWEFKDGGVRRKLGHKHWPG